jgi:conjugal transfer mating pair stabilization protein TraG
MPSLLKLLPSVRVPKVVVIAAAAHNARLSLGIPGNTMITSGNDAQHMAGSLHYQDRALDFRTRDLSPVDVQRWAAAIRSRLGPDYDVVIESDHIHIEHDPKGTPQ